MEDLLLSIMVLQERSIKDIIKLKNIKKDAMQMGSCINARAPFLEHYNLNCPGSVLDMNIMVFNRIL
jgi:hypothetical protein